MAITISPLTGWIKGREKTASSAAAYHKGRISSTGD